MALVTTDFLAAVMTNYRAIFEKALGEGAMELNDYLKIATEITSTTDTESYNWLGATPNMSERKDERSLKGLNAFNYSLKNVHYEGTIEVDRDTYEDERLGMIPPRVRGLAMSALRHYCKKVFSQLDDGETLLAYDGAAFFGTTRTIKSSGTISNVLSGNYSDSSAEILAGVAAATAAMRAFKDDWGEPLNLIPDTVVCAPERLTQIQNALLPAYPGLTRPEMAYVKSIICSPYIDADTDDWFMLCTTDAVKPLIFQNRKKPEFIALDDPKSDHVFKNRTFLYGVDDRFAVGYGDPRTAILLHNT